MLSITSEERHFRRSCPSTRWGFPLLWRSTSEVCIRSRWALNRSVHQSIGPFVYPPTHKAGKVWHAIGRAHILYPIKRAYFYHSGSEFGKDFKKTLRLRNIRQYHVHTGVFPKISLVEAVIKSIKRIFFRCLLEFQSVTYSNILKLVQAVYNNRWVG